METDKNTLELNNGCRMPQVGLGTWQSKPGEVEAAVRHALKVGYRHVDCAAVYGNEAEVGAGLKAVMEELRIPRQEVFVTSKLWNTDHHPDDVEKACRKTLADLGLDYVDLYLIHWPIAFVRGSDRFPRNEDGTLKYDDDVSPTETWLAMEKLVEKGLAKSIGVSNFNSKQILDILDKGKIKPVTNQVECHLYLNQAKLLNFCKDHGIVLTAFSPLGAPQRPWAKDGEPNILAEARLKEIAGRKNKSPAQVALRWQLQRGVVVIPKSVTPSRIDENLDLFDFSLDAEEMAELDSLDINARLVVPKLPDGTFRDAVCKHFPFNIEF